MDHQTYAKKLRQNMTEAEQRLWHNLRAHRLQGQKFRRQQPIWPYIVDFVHFKARLVIEADGGQHNESNRDRERDWWFQCHGFQVLHFWNTEILRNTEAVLEVIWEAAASSPSP